MTLRGRLLSWAVLAAFASALALGDEADLALTEARKAQQELREAVARASRPFVFVGGGSGVCISEDGYILTNNHVVARHAQWMVRVYGAGKLALADVVGRDTQGDVALLKIEKASGLPFAPLAEFDGVRVGQRVLALGDPYKLGDMDGAPSASFGMLCGLHRYLGDPENADLRTFYADALQTDAAVNPGNSGGPLFTLDGKLLGLTGQIMARFGGKTNSGIAYAVPADQIARFLTLLKTARGGTVWHGDFPAGMRLSREGETDTGRPKAAGAWVQSVERGSAAWEAGFRGGDRITKADGEAICGAYRLLGVIQSRAEGAQVPVALQRDGHMLEFTIRLARFEMTAAVEVKPAGAIHTVREDAEGPGSGAKSGHPGR